ncbi:hypothetical protein TKK_0009948 [Trichogramma kaykai]
MTAHVMCLTSSGGIPLFVRKKGNGDLMTFSKMASLNGIHMFLKTHNIELLNTDMPDATIVWKEFHKCIILIAIANASTKKIIDELLEAVFNTMILFIGLKDIQQPRSVERLKRDLRSCYPVIDKLLECSDIGDAMGSKSDLIDLTNCIMCSENHLLQVCLEGYMECLESLYGCMLIHNCIAVATNSWWSLDLIERKLLMLATTSENSSTIRQLPIFLPNKSPNIAYRLVNVTLVNNIRILALCGPNPELSEIEKLTLQIWKNSTDLLQASEQCYPRNLPASIILDTGILGFLLVNYKIGKYVLSRNTQHLKNFISSTHKLDTLKTFYNHTIEIFLVSTSEENKNDLNCNKASAGMRETYWCSEYHKCHALKEADHIFCVLYSSTVPSHTMRLLTKKTLKMLLSDKQVCW